jgi:hypothetical protein
MEAWLEKVEANQENLEVKMEANQENIEGIVEHYRRTPCVKAMHLLTTPQGWAFDILHRAPKGVTYKETIRATED